MMKKFSLISIGQYLKRVECHTILQFKIVVSVRENFM